MAGDDTWVNVHRLCWRADHPLSEALLTKVRLIPEFADCHIQTPAVCVYPNNILEALSAIRDYELKPKKIAAVGTGFPSGQYPLGTRLKEIEWISKIGCDEVDVVINRALALEGKWDEVYNELVKMRKACENMRLKVILEVGELGSLLNVYKASWTAMLAGADFIKTSTGKVSVNATLPVGFVMTRAIYEFHQKYKTMVGLKPAGGLRTESDCLYWYQLVWRNLGNEWLQPDYFRIGASSLLNEIERRLFYYLFNRDPSPHELCL